MSENYFFEFEDENGCTRITLITAQQEAKFHLPGWLFDIIELEREISDENIQLAEELMIKEVI